MADETKQPAAEGWTGELEDQPAPPWHERVFPSLPVTDEPLSPLSCDEESRDDR